LALIPGLVVLPTFGAGDRFQAGMGAALLRASNPGAGFGSPSSNSGNCSCFAAK